MKIEKQVVLGVVVVVVIVIAAYGASMYQRYRSRGEFAQRIFIQGNGSSPNTVEELRTAITAYEKRIDQHVQDAAKTASYWKILAVRLQERGLHGEALEALQRAIYYNPEDPFLHYYVGISASIVAKSFHIYPGAENPERYGYFILAENAFLRAIELDSRYLRPRYSLSVLYVFDLDRPEDALPHLDRYLEISRNDVDTLFVLARAYFMMRRYQAALDVYDRILTLTRDEQKRIDAQNNRQTVMGLLYG